MLLYEDRYVSSFVSFENLEKISRLLKNGRTVQSRVMDFILTMLGCIVLKVDHRPHLLEFWNVFGETSLETLRGDFENVLLFNARIFDRLMRELVAETLKRENNYRHRSNNTWSIVNSCNTRWNRVILQRRIRSVIKFLIFHEARATSGFYVEHDIRNLSSYKLKIAIVLDNGITSRNKSMFDKEEYIRGSKHGRVRENNKFADAAKSLRSLLKTLFDFARAWRTDHLSNRISCLLRYGLWILLYYSSTFVFLAVLNITYKFFHEIEV